MINGVSKEEHSGTQEEGIESTPGDHRKHSVLGGRDRSENQKDEHIFAKQINQWMG